MRSTLIAAALALAAALPAPAATLPADGSWASFAVDANLPPYSFGWVDANGAPPSFGFSIAPGQVGTLDFNAALANPDFSRGSFTLDAGSHAITGVMFESTTDAFGPLNATPGGVRPTINPAPEPATAATALIGVGLLLGGLRRRAD